MNTKERAEKAAREKLYQARISLQGAWRESYAASHAESEAHKLHRRKLIGYAELEETYKRQARANKKVERWTLKRLAAEAALNKLTGGEVQR